MAAMYCVSGGRALKGTVRPAGNKNAALPILAATLLVDGPCRIDGVPRIRDVEPMLARFGRVSLPPPGGDIIGRRRVDTHLLALERLGVTITVGDTYQFEGKKLAAADIFLDEPSVTATENALMAAVAVPGTTVLRNAASEPHVQDLARFLVACGARIDGVGTNTLTVEGGAPLTGGAAPFTVGPDHIEIGSFIGLA